MAVVTTKAGAITNRDASPRVASNANIARSNLKEAVGTVETVIGDSIGSKYLLANVPSNARISQVLLYSDDIGTVTAADFGLYQTTDNGGAVVDADFFASAVDLAGGAINGTDIAHESAVFGLEDMEKMVWEALGLTSDPCISYDVAATLTAAADSAGTISLLVRYGE